MPAGGMLSLQNFVYELSMKTFPITLTMRISRCVSIWDVFLLLGWLRNHNLQAHGKMGAEFSSFASCFAMLCKDLNNYLMNSYKLVVCCGTGSSEYFNAIHINDIVQCTHAYTCKWIITDPVYKFSLHHPANTSQLPSCTGPCWGGPPPQHSSYSQSAAAVLLLHYSPAVIKCWHHCAASVAKLAKAKAVPR